MKNTFLAVVVLGAIFASQSFAYVGSLQVADGELNGTGFWITDNGETEWFPAYFSWNVTQNLDLTWHYEYNLDVYRADISHIIIETSLSFGIGNLLNPDYPGTSYEIMTHEAGSAGNPSLPDDIYGPKFDIGDAGLDEPQYDSITISFDSDRDPVWGDFYAKCGKVGGTQNTIWNEGFVTADPLDAPADGTVLNHVLVPNTIPEPTTIALLGLGAFGILRKRRA